MKLFFALFWIPVLASSEPKEHWVLWERDVFPDKEFTAITLDSSDNIWFGTKKGLVKMTSGENWEMYNHENTSGGLISDVVTCMSTDEYGDLWIGTDSGLSVYSNGSWSQITVETSSNGLPHNHILSMAMDKNSNKWLGTKNGFAEYSNSIWTTYGGDKISGYLKNPQIFAIEVGDNKNIWLGTVSGIFKFDGSNFEGYNKTSTDGGIPNNYITDIKYKGKDSLWVATQNGLAVFNQKKWKSITKENNSKVPGEIAYCLAFAKDGGVWAGFKGGVFGYQNGEWFQYNKNNTYAGLPSIRIYAIISDRQNNMWFGTREGLAQLKRTP